MVGECRLARAGRVGSARGVEVVVRGVASRFSVLVPPITHLSGLVLGRIDAEFGDQIFVGKRLVRSVIGSIYENHGVVYFIVHTTR